MIGIDIKRCRNTGNVTKSLKMLHRILKCFRKSTNVAKNREMLQKSLVIFWNIVRYCRKTGDVAKRLNLWIYRKYYR